MDIINPPATKKQRTANHPLPQIVSIASFDIDCGSSCHSSSTPSLSESCTSEDIVAGSIAIDSANTMASCVAASVESEHKEEAPMVTQVNYQEVVEPVSSPPSPPSPKSLGYAPKEYLRELATSSSIEQATQAMQMLYNGLGSVDENNSNTAMSTQEIAQQITSDLWFSSLVGCLARYRHSEELSLLVITFLATLLFYETKTANILVDLGAIDTIVDTARAHPGSELMSVNSVGFISNLACETGNVRASVAHEKCIAFMADCMQWRPYNESIQRAGCIYFKHIVEMDGGNNDGKKRTLLEDNNVFLSLATAMKYFRYAKNEDMYDCAKDVSKQIIMMG